MATLADLIILAGGAYIVSNFLHSSTKKVQRSHPGKAVERVLAEYDSNGSRWEHEHAYDKPVQNHDGRAVMQRRFS